MWMVVAALVALLLPAGSGMAQAPGPNLPIASLAEVGRYAIGSSLEGQCAGKPVLIAVVAVGGVTYDFVTDGTQFILADRGDGDGTPVWGGVVEAGGQLRAVDYLPYGQWVQRFTQTVCRYFGRGVEGKCSFCSFWSSLSAASGTLLGC